MQIWVSPLAAHDAAAASQRFGALAGTARGAVWIEERPSEEGRGVIVARSDGKAPEDLLPPPFSARTRVHEYGGGALHARGAELWFVNHKDQQVYLLRRDEEPRRLTASDTMRFADMFADPARERLVAVGERHGGGNGPENFIAAIGTGTPDAGVVAPLVQGADFYAAPRISPDGRWLAWLEWNLPHMPWEAAQLFCAPLAADGSVGDAALITGGPDGAAFQPEWDGDGTLYFVAETGTWSGLHAWRDGRISPVFTPEAELMRPLWALGQTSYAILEDGRIAAAAIRDGGQELWLVDPQTGDASEVNMPYRTLDQVAARAGGGLYAIAADDADMPAVVELRLEKGKPDWRRISRKSSVSLPADMISPARALAFETANGESVHALYYEPRNPGFRHASAPPMIVLAHGGPTGAATRGLQLRTQFWTSRGFAVLDVDYRGSTGYGRAYRESLQGEWGVFDADDIVAAATAAAAQGLADPDRLVVSGRSAGGFTALCALMRSDVFRAATVHYGVADLATLLDTTHKFEAGYIYGLTGTAPGMTSEVFAARSPLAQASRISAPVLLLQGGEDAVVPPAQARDIAETLKGNGVPVAYLEFAGEGHGFRRAETIRDVLRAELSFLAIVLGLESNEPLIDLEIWNWSDRA